MRLFIGIELEHVIKFELNRATECLKELARGNFSNADNLHITLQFLGEKDPSEIETIQKAMQKAVVGFKAFMLSLGSPGRFDRNSESIVWYGISGDLDRLNELWQLLGQALLKYGISFDRSAFKPHITLGRRIRPTAPWEEVLSKITMGEKSFRVEKIVLFESTRINGKLTYIPVSIRHF